MAAGNERSDDAEPDHLMEPLEDRDAADACAGQTWSRTIWFHIAVGAATKNGKQITVAAAALAIMTRKRDTVPAEQQQPAKNDQEGDDSPDLDRHRQPQQRPGGEGLAVRQRVGRGRGAAAGGWRSAVPL